MKFNIKINSAETIDAVPGYWSSQDYINLLEKFNYPDGENAAKDNLEELLLMAITDYEPNEAAAIVLEYKLAEQLNDGKIHQISNDMLLDKISEEYPDISLHSTLFHINQLLFKAFNGRFPNIKATRINFVAIPADNEEEIDLTKENILNLFENGLSQSNLIKRLFGEQLTGIKPFPEAENILWELKSLGNLNYELLTSDYWISRDDLVAEEFEGVIEKVKQVEEAN